MDELRRLRNRERGISALEKSILNVWKQLGTVQHARVLVRKFRNSIIARREEGKVVAVCQQCSRVRR